MVDTLILKIYGLENFHIKRIEGFVPEFEKREFADLSATERYKKNRLYLRKFVLQDKPLGIYTPKVEIFETVDHLKNVVDYDLRLEFSAPKLIFNNNLEELSQTDLIPVIRALQERLLDIGINIWRGSILKASVSAIHFGKNIFLPKTILIREILEELLKIGINKPDDVTKGKYRNGAETLQFFSSVREFAFYDKIRDLKKTKNKRVDKSQKTTLENEIIEIYNLENKECFRFEYRLKDPRTIKSEVNTILGRDYQTAVTFEDIFSDDLWKKIIIKSWYQLIDRPQNQIALLSTATTEANIFTHMLSKVKNSDQDGHSQNKFLTSYGLAIIIRNKGVKAVKDEFDKIWSDKSGERFSDKIKLALEFTKGLSYSDRISFIGRELDLFARMDLKLLKDLKLYYD